jgi:hypothetical protein
LIDITAHPEQLEAYLRWIISNVERKYLMQNLSPRRVQTEESLSFGVTFGWYSTEVSGTAQI